MHLPKTFPQFTDTLILKLSTCQRHRTRKIYPIFYWVSFYLLSHFLFELFMNRLYKSVKTCYIQCINICVIKDYTVASSKRTPALLLYISQQKSYFLCSSWLKKIIKKNKIVVSSCSLSLMSLKVSRPPIEHKNLIQFSTWKISVISTHFITYLIPHNTSAAEHEY